MTLIELVMFIVVVGVGLAGILAVLTVSTKSSADPMIRKNMLAIAEALLEEVRMMPFTYCDPDDANAATASSPAGCTTQEGLGRELAETTRTGAPANPFDNVSDYAAISGNTHGLGDATNPIKNLDGAGSAPAGYVATIDVANDNGLGVSGSEPPGADVLRITVAVTHGADSLTLEGYRTRHSPNWVP